MSRTRRGKIAKLPADLRMEVNRRLHDGQTAGQLLPWLNNHARVRPILGAQFHGEDINAQNLTEWRQGGYVDWLEERERLDALKEISLFAGDAVKAGGSISDGAAAVAAGRLMTAIEGADDEQLLKISSAIGNLRCGDSDRVRLRLKEREVKAKEEKLALDEKRFMYRSAEAALKLLDSQKARDIAMAPDVTAPDKVQALGKLMFGDDWQ